MGIHKYSSTYEEEEEEEEDYINIELFSSPNFFCYSITSPSPTRDFEFQMCPFPLHKTSPADELFYKGKLLPLHFPPRLQMLQTLLQDPTSNYSLPPFKCDFSGFATEKSVGNSYNSDGNRDECFFQFSTELRSFINYHPSKKSNWTDKLNQKIKASTAYLKSLFTKSGDEFSCTKAAASSTAVQPKQAVSPRGEDYFDNLRYMKVSKKCPFGEIDNGRPKLSTEKAQRRRHSSTYSSSSGSSSSGSSSSSSSSNSTFSFSSLSDSQLLKRSISENNSEIENSIEGAIAYCKKSYQQLLCSTEVEGSSLPASAVVTCGNN